MPTVPAAETRWGRRATASGLSRRAPLGGTGSGAGRQSAHSPCWCILGRVTQPQLNAPRGKAGVEHWSRSALGSVEGGELV